MQIKAIFIFLIFLISNCISFAQLKWIIPLTYGLQPLDSKERLYFKYENGKSIYVNDTGKIIEIDFPFDRSIGYSYFTYLKDGFYGCKKLEEGEIFPPGFDRISPLTDNFFLLSVYGICKLVTKDNKILLPYDCNNMKFYNYNHDTILYMSIIKMDTTWGGFLANGNKIDPLVAAKRYPTKYLRLKKLMEENKAKLPEVYVEGSYAGLKSNTGRILIPPEYSNIFQAYPGYYGVIKNGKCGMVKIE